MQTDRSVGIFSGSPLLESSEFVMSASDATSAGRSANGETAIIEAATRLFAEQGFEAVSVAQIARDAGVGKATVFHHFPSKLALYEAVLDRIGSDALWIVEDESWRSQDAESFLAGYIEREIRHLESNRAMLALVMREMLNFDSEENMRRLAQIFDRPFDELAERLRGFQQSGQLNSEEDPEILAHLLMHAGVSFISARPVVQQMRGGAFIEAPEEYARSVARMLVHGDRGDKNPQSSNLPRDGGETP